MTFSPNATPKTDEVERQYCGTHSHHVLLQHARQLERENFMLSSERDALLAQRDNLLYALDAIAKESELLIIKRARDAMTLNCARASVERRISDADNV